MLYLQLYLPSLAGVVGVVVGEDEVVGDGALPLLLHSAVLGVFNY